MLPYSMIKPRSDRQVIACRHPNKHKTRLVCWHASSQTSPTYLYSTTEWRPASNLTFRGFNWIRSLNRLISRGERVHNRLICRGERIHNRLICRGERIPKKPRGERVVFEKRQISLTKMSCDCKAKKVVQLQGVSPKFSWCVGVSALVC